MRVNEVITESVLDEWSDTVDGIGAALKKKGYKRLGAGVDQTAYVEPGTGLVLKVFGTQRSVGNRFTKDHKMFFKWYEFCTANKTNPFLPEFFGHDTFLYQGDRYLQIRTERLFPVPSNIRDSLESLAFNAKMNRDLDPFLHNHQYDDDVSRLVVLLGKQGLEKLSQTIKQVVALGRKYGYMIDLHSGNFMMGSDGQVVINDPWVVSD